MRGTKTRAGRKEAGIRPPVRRRGAAAVRHVVMALVAGVLVAGFWLRRMDWSPDMRTWRAFGDAAVVLLFVTLALGPAARLWRSIGRLLPWRREAGVWFAVMALVHALLVLDGWVNWQWGRLMGYEFIPEVNRVVRIEPGFGLANLLGMAALLWALILAATSSDRALRALGPESWRWMHHGAYVIFYLAVLHSAYFLFIHYTLSFHRAPPPPNWFRWPLVVMGISVAALQWIAFVKVARRRTSRTRRSAGNR